MADSPFEKRKWSIKKKLLIFVVLPLLVLVGLALILDAIASNRLQMVMHEAREDGGPVTFKELEGARKVWPDEQNGARIILALTARLDELSKDPAIKVLPPFSDKPTLLLGARLSPEELAAAEAGLKHLQPELAEIDRLRGFEGGQFPVTIAENPIATLLPSLGPLRTWAKIKSAQAECRAMRGDTSQLADDVTIIHHHAQLVAEDPFLISSLVGMAIDGLAIDTIERSLGLTSAPPEQLKRLDDLLATLEGQDRLSWAMRGERAGFIGATEYVRAHGGSALDELSSVSGWAGPSPSIPRGIQSIPGLRGLLMRDETAGLRMFNRMVAAAKNPRKAMAICGEIDKQIDTSPPYLPMTRMLIPSLSRCFALDRRLEGNIRAARAGLAVERYRLDNGHFPASLEELAPKYLPRVPLDPFDDKPLRYRVDQYGVAIYSIGEDMTDDGGQVNHRVAPNDAHDVGFMLLPPELRGRPATQPATEPTEEQAERLRQFREGEAPAGR